MLKKWILVFALVFACLTVAIGFFNYKMDPFGYWKSRKSEADYSAMSFGRHGKASYLKSNSEKYSAVILGGSNASFLNPKVASQLTGSKTFNFSNMYGDSTDYLQLVDYYIKKMPNLKEIMIQISNEEFHPPLKRPAYKLPAYITGESELLEILTFIFINPKDSFTTFMSRVKTKKQNDNFTSSEIVKFDGFSWDLRLYDFSDETQYNHVIHPLDAEVIFRDFNTILKILFETQQRDFSAEDICIENFAQIKRLCEENDIRLTVWVCACFISKKAMFEGEQYYAFLKRLAKITDFWDFSGFSDANLNPYNFYDPKHFNYETGDEILKIVLGGKQNPAFGEYLGAQNIDQAIARRRDAFEALKTEYELTGTVHLFDKTHESYFRREGE